MKSQWSDGDANAAIARYAKESVSEDVALRVYTSRLLGADPTLVLHGGGNTSVKTSMTDGIGDVHDVICVKGSGWDMAAIEPPGLPAVKLAPLLRLRELQDLSDEEMVNQVRLALLENRAPTPSIETLLHAFLPHKFVDHTHANAVLSLVDQPNSADIASEVWGDEMAFIPYIMPGFSLSKAAAAAYAAANNVKGLILDRHGIFTFAESARDAYGLMIEMVSRAESYIDSADRKPFAARELPKQLAKIAEVAPIVRGLLAESNDGGDRRRMVLSHRGDNRDYTDGADLSDYSQRGVVTPDHIIRTKNKPLILSPPATDDLDGFAAAAKEAITEYAAAYRVYFEANNTASDDAKMMLDPLPRVVFVPGIGLFGVGRSRSASEIAADIAEATARTIRDAESVGRFTPLSERELFKMEYWSLEQAKLGASLKPLQGQIATVTGGAGTIGMATAKLLVENGAEVALLDLDPNEVSASAAEIGGAAIGIVCDVTERDSVDRAFSAVVERFSGLDILVSNAGAAWQGEIGAIDDATLRKSFDLNFFGHQNAAQAAVKIMLSQGTGGALLFNASKQAVSPGHSFGAYGLPKAATLFLSRQYALEYGSVGIRSNAVNADRIRSGLMTDAMIGERAAARKVDPAEYLAGNLLGAEVTAEDVAQAFLHQALALKTTASVTTVDGGNIAASLR